MIDIRNNRAKCGKFLYKYGVRNDGEVRCAEQRSTAVCESWFRVASSTETRTHSSFLREDPNKKGEESLSDERERRGVFSRSIDPPSSFLRPRARSHANERTDLPAETRRARRPDRAHLRTTTTARGARRGPAQCARDEQGRVVVRSAPRGARRRVAPAAARAARVEHAHTT